MYLLFYILISIQIDLQENYPTSDHHDFLNGEAAQGLIEPRNIDHELLELCIFHATNELREKKHLPVMEHSEDLYSAARGHAVDMAMYDYFSHQDRFDRSSMDRITLEGGDYHFTGENIAMFYPYDMDYRKSYYPIENEMGYEYRYTGSKDRIPNIRYADFARMVVDQWYHSKGHRENLLDKNFQFLGCGAQISPNPERSEEMPKVYLVQNFGGRED